MPFKCLKLWKSLCLALENSFCWINNHFHPLTVVTFKALLQKNSWRAWKVHFQIVCLLLGRTEVPTMMLHLYLCMLGMWTGYSPVYSLISCPLWTYLRGQDNYRYSPNVQNMQTSVPATLIRYGMSVLLERLPRNLVCRLLARSWHCTG